MLILCINSENTTVRIIKHIKPQLTLWFSNLVFFKMLVCVPWLNNRKICQFENISSYRNFIN